MQSMQRQFGRLWNKGPGDNAKVSVLLNDYEDVDKVLAQTIDNVKLWRNAWASLVHSQFQLVSEFEGLYDPIVGASDGHGRQRAPTPQLQLERSLKLKTAYDELRTELVEEVAMIEEQIVRPATEARDCIAPIRKTIKKRENKRLDYERLQEKATKLQRKQGRTPKEDAALSKAEAEMSRAADEFAIADDHLRQTLPPVVASSFGLVPLLLANIVLIQNRLLGLYYTTLHDYCQDVGFPSPPPPMRDVTAVWNASFGPVRSEAESISFIARGKAVRQPMSPGPADARIQQHPASAAPPVSTNGARRAPNAPVPTPKPQTLRLPVPSSSSAPTDFTTATLLGGGAVTRSATPSSISSASATTTKHPAHHHHPHHHLATAGATAASSSSSLSSSSTVAAATAALFNNGLAVKKLPPPPPPPPQKRLPNGGPEEWVVARYAFAGEGEGDLSFRAGDRIRVVKRTETDQDWWIGELGGVRGNFPANYCKPA